MAIVTYILLTAIHKGLEKNFNPKVRAVHHYKCALLSLTLPSDPG